MPDQVRDPKLGEGRAVEGMAVVPDVWGDSEEVALEKLRLSGFRAGPRREAPSKRSVTGSVIRTIPAAGSLLARGERVSYVVARGSSGRRAHPRHDSEGR